MSVLSKIISVMQENGGKCHLNILYNAIDEYKHDSIRQCLYIHSSDSTCYQGKADVFYCVNGVASRNGVWGLRENNNISLNSPEKQIQMNNKSSLSEDNINSKTLISLNEYLCNLSNKKNIQNYKSGKVSTSKSYKDLNCDEGDVDERKFLARKRNQIVVKMAKERDNYTCQACNFNFNNLIVEAHHLTPLCKSGKVAVNIDNLITLCPNCHSLAHILVKYDHKYTQKALLLSTIKDLLINKKEAQ